MSSIYGNAERLENVVPELRKVVPGLSAVVGCSSAGAIGMQSKGRVVEVSDRTGRATSGMQVSRLTGTNTFCNRADRVHVWLTSR